MSNDIISFVEYFYKYISIKKGCNAFFLTVILMIRELKSIKDFRHINLIGCQHKIFGKLFTNMLDLVNSIVISVDLSTFIKGR